MTSTRNERMKELRSSVRNFFGCLKSSIRSYSLIYFITLVSGLIQNLYLDQPVAYDGNEGRKMKEWKGWVDIFL